MRINPRHFQLRAGHFVYEIRKRRKRAFRVKEMHFANDEAARRGSMSINAAFRTIAPEPREAALGPSEPEADIDGTRRRASARPSRRACRGADARNEISRNQPPPAGVGKAGELLKRLRRVSGETWRAQCERSPDACRNHWHTVAADRWSSFLPSCPCIGLPSRGGFGIIVAMNDDDSFFWFLAGCAAGDQTRRLRPRDKWDAVAYVVAAVCVVAALVFASR